MLDRLQTSQSLQPDDRKDDVARSGRDAIAAKLFGEFPLKFWGTICGYMVDQLLREIRG
jgi:hypothetical protein